MYNLELRDIASHFSSFPTLSLQQQAIIISSLPNLHNWSARKNSGVKRDQHFADHGKSPRNRLIRNILAVIGHVDNDNINEIFFNARDERALILKCIVSNVFHVDEETVLTVERKKTTKKAKPKVTTDDILAHLNLTTDILDGLKTQTQFSVALYDNFKAEMSIQGSLHWRIHSDQLECVVMNDCNPETGEFMVAALTLYLI